MSLPAVADTFRWTPEPWGAALRCLPLEPLAPHLFTTRQLAFTAPADADAAAAAVAASHLVFLKQVHGADMTVIRAANEVPPPWCTGDALISSDASVAVAVKTADCVPLLMADAARGVVAAVHAGWRGTAAGIVAAAVARLEREFGTSPEDLVVAVGPSIGPCCYEVGSELVDAFAANGHARHLIDRWFIAQPPPRGSREPSRLRLDVAAANRDQLILAGVPAAQIHMSGLCTAMHLDVLTSYRAEKERAGRLAAIIRPRSVTAP